MKIDPTSRLQPSPTSESKPDKNAGRPEAGPLPGDQSALSALANHLNAPSDEREQRIEALRAAVENGTYHFSSTDLATSIIEAHSTRHQ